MHLLITAGPTREFFDTVRFISNASTGKMGFAIAAEAARRGHVVTLVAGPVVLPDPTNVRVVHVVSADEMLEAAVAAFDECHAAVMTAAVCDYRPPAPPQHKLQKQAAPRAVTLEPTTDICAHLGAIKGDRVVVGFAMEDHDPEVRAEHKLKRKRCDAIVLNSVTTAGGDSAQVRILRRDGVWGTPQAGSKSRIAEVVVDLVEGLLADRA